MDAVVAHIEESLVALATNTIPPAVRYTVDADLLAPHSIPPAVWLALDIHVRHTAHTVPVGVHWAALAQVVHAFEETGLADTTNSIEVGVGTALDRWNGHAEITVECETSVAGAGESIPIRLIGTSLD